MAKRSVWVTTAMALLLGLAMALPGGGLRQVGAQEAEQPQTILPPGLYLFQSRTRSGTCDDAPRTGYVTSQIATLDGIPGDRHMIMKADSKYWPKWELNVAGQDTVVGDAVMFGGSDRNKGTSHFEVKPFKDRLQGTGSREYAGPGGKRCTLLYDALLKPIE